MKKVDVSQLTGKIIVLNLYLTQGIALILAIVGIFFFMDGSLFANLKYLLDFSSWQKDVLIGACLGISVVLIQLVLHRFLPPHYFDDGGINTKLFQYLRPLHIVFITALIAFAEELLFRGLIQNSIGLFWTSILFTVVHFRYLHQWFMISFVFLLSFAIGYIYTLAHSLWAPITAHFIIDLILGLIIHYNWLHVKAGKNGEGGEFE